MDVNSIDHLSYGLTMVPLISWIELIFPSIMIFLIGLFVSLLVTKNIVISLFIALIKSFIFFIYFSLIFSQSHTFESDDIFYLGQAKDFIDKDINYIYQYISSIYLIFTAYFSEATLSEVLAPDMLYIITITKFHFIYQLYNAFSFDLFGYYHYSSPVALNIILTFFSGYLLFKLLSLLAINKKIISLFYIFYIFHWYVYIWSGFFNFKETLVQFILIIFTYYFFKYKLLTLNKIDIVVITLAIIISLNLRLYVFIIFTLSIFVTNIIIRTKNKELKLKFIYLALSIIIAVISVALYMKFSGKIEFSIFKIITGGFRMFLMPIPFNISDNFPSYLFPSFLHWLFLPFFFLGVISLYKINKNTLLLAILLILFMLLYGQYDNLQGLRHRGQVEYLIILYQYFGLVYFLKKIQ
jgi:hypothetical protein